MIDWYLSSACDLVGWLHREELHPVQDLAPDDVTEQDGSSYICNIITKLCPHTFYLNYMLHLVGKDDITGLGG